jgi:hypothetical protein
VDSTTFSESLAKQNFTKVQSFFVKSGKNSTPALSGPHIFLAHAAKILPSWHQSLCRVVIFCENLSPILVLLCGTQLTFVQQF